MSDCRSILSYNLSIGRCLAMKGIHSDKWKVRNWDIFWSEFCIKYYNISVRRHDWLKKKLFVLDIVQKGHNRIKRFKRGICVMFAAFFSKDDQMSKSHQSYFYSERDLWLLTTSDHSHYTKGKQLKLVSENQKQKKKS